MARVFLLMLVVGVLVWWFAARGRSRETRRRETPPTPEAFARCAHCGVHLPTADALVERGLNYCSEAHRKAGPKDRSGA